MTTSESSEALRARNGNSSDTKSQDQQPQSKNALMKLKSYLIALRVWSLSASIIPTILGEV
jgi:hypothetical protein